MSLPLLFLKNAELTFGGNPVFDKLSMQIMPEDKICLVGRNGCGKSTLFKVLASIYELDKGEFYKHPGLNVGYLPQTVTFNDRDNVYDYVLKDIKLGAGETKEDNIYRADKILNSLNLGGYKLMKRLSGGKLRRAALAKALIDNPEILLLDEPTNHLDIASIEWLEEYLSNYKGSFICISHDREFLKNISNKIFWLDRGTLKTLNKGFAEFENWSSSVMEQEEIELQKLNKKLEGENLWLQQGVTARRKRNQGRLKSLFTLREQLKNDKSNLSKATNTIKLPPLSAGQNAKLVLEMDSVCHSFTDVTPPKQTINNFSLRITRGEKIGLMGRNGAGKTTFLKLLIGELKPTSGTIRLGANLNISYSDQQREVLDPDQTLWQTLCPGGGDNITVAGEPKHVVSYLKDFLFDAAQIKSPVGSLSGGEANRLILAKILANPGNLLILDEPTNDLDMDTLDMLEDILSDYKGTLLIVSHDRDFLERIVTRTIIFEQDGSIQDYYGGYTEYKKALKLNNVKKKSLEKTPIDIKKENNNFSYKFKRELELLPNQIDDLTKEINQLEQQLAGNNFYSQDPEGFNQSSKNLLAKKQTLENLEVRWLELEELRQSSNG
jgi:ATP-binding cassette subfamily F protein uup